MLASFTDTVEIRDAKPTRHGGLVFDAPVARIGVYQYLDTELDLPGAVGKMVGVYRPEASVMDEKSLSTLAHVAITDDHPAQDVSASNWRDLARGWTEGKVARHGDMIHVPMMLADAGIVSKVKGGKVQLSPGYRAELTEQAGVHDGAPYDFVMGPPTYNHVAVVDRARGGNHCRLGDAWPGTAPPPITDGDRPMGLRTIIVDGLSVEATDASALAIEKLQGQVRDSAAALTASQAKVGELTVQLGDAKGEVAGLTQKLADAVITPAMMDAAVLARTAIVTDAKAIFGDTAYDPAGKTDAQVRRDAVTHKLGDAATKDMDDAAVGGAFRALKPAASDTVRQTVLGDGGQVLDLADATKRAEKARSEYLDSLKPKAA